MLPTGTMTSASTTPPASNQQTTTSCAGGPIPGRGRFDHHPVGPPTDHAPHHGITYLAPDAPTATTVDSQSTVLDVVLSEAVQDGDVLAVTGELAHLNDRLLRWGPET